MTIQYLPVQPYTPHWHRDAACAEVGGDAWHPEKGGSVREAKRVCAGCSVRDECLQDALEHNDRWGIWGGLTDAERRKLRPANLATARPKRLTDAAVGIRKRAA